MTAMRAILILAMILAAAVYANVHGQGREAFSGSFKDPAIDYYNAPLDDAVTRLSRALASGSRRLSFDADAGYLNSVLAALDIPIESQVLVFSQTSLQAPAINEKNPRAVYFNDHAAVGWVRGGTVLEIAAQDPRQGLIFYRLEQDRSSRPHFERSTECLRCHISWETLAVPGALVLSTGPDDAAGYATGGVVDHRNDIQTRWGHWYLTGKIIPQPGLGTAVTSPPWLASRFDVKGYPSVHSDIVALMVLEHQTHAMNLITYLGWETRIGASERRIDTIAGQLADYLLFVDEAPLPGSLRGSSGFAERFPASYPRDARERSLGQFDLDRRLMKYPCSYMVYSAAFDALPARAKSAVYDRMFAILSGRETDKRYATLTSADRQNVTDILRETKPDFATRVHHEGR
jgi:hypothetical protein